jgi:hypothetical protein
MKVLLWFEPCPFVDVSNRELAGKIERLELASQFWTVA